MFTDCPACARQFRIRAEQLSAANGEVKCGYCGEQFSALGRLRDKPLLPQEPSIPELNEEEYVEPEFDIPELDSPSENPEEDASEEPDVEKEVLDSIEEAVSEDSQEELVEEVNTDFVFPEELVNPEVKRSSWFNKLVWTFLILSLLLVAVTQLVWFNRDQVLSRYPELLPYARQLCERVQCELIRYRNVAEIKLLNRDVRDHPRYERALLVNATLINEASVIQPFPRIQLGLFDTDGRLLAYREFSSADYLDESINVENGMLPNKPIHIVLEVIGPTEGAVSFEFRFL